MSRLKNLKTFTYKDWVLLLRSTKNKTNFYIFLEDDDSDIADFTGETITRTMLFFNSWRGT